MPTLPRRFRDAAYVLAGQLPPAPVPARHAEWSVIASADDVDPPVDDLITLLLSAADLARTVDMGDLVARSGSPDALFVQTWPGEHYRLLTALATVWQTQLAVEVGTFRGHGALALAAGLPAGGRVVTYDVVPWTAIESCVLRSSDQPRVEQRIGDLADAGYLHTQIDTLRSADLLFIDGPKDGQFEPEFCRAALGQLNDRRRLVVFDDIRLMNMVGLWRGLPYPKLDATSFGHWSGTGLLFTR